MNITQKTVKIESTVVDKVTERVNNTIYVSKNLRRPYGLFDIPYLKPDLPHVSTAFINQELDLLSIIMESITNSRNQHFTSISKFSLICIHMSEETIGANPFERMSNLLDLYDNCTYYLHFEDTCTYIRIFFANLTQVEPRTNDMRTFF